MTFPPLESHGPEQPIVGEFRARPTPAPERFTSLIRPAPAAGKNKAPSKRGRTWDPVLICLAIYILTGVGRIHQLFAPLGVVKPLLLASLFAAFFYAIDRSPARQFAPVLRSPTMRWAIAMVFWAGLSVLTALRQGQALYSFLDSLPKTVILALIIVGAARDWRDVERLAFVYLLSVATYAAVVLLRFEVTDEKWRLNKLYYYDANDFATLAVTALPLALYFMVTRRHWVARTVATIGAGCILMAFIWSGSRGGFLALLAVSGFLLVRFKAIHAGWRLAAAGTIAIALVATASETYWEKMNSIIHPETDYNVSNRWGRVQVWQRGIGYMLRFPVSGVGYDNFPVAEGTLFPAAVELESHGKGAKWGVAHNSFVQVGAELGIPGLVFFVGLLCSALLAVRRVRAVPRGPRGPPHLARCLMASLIGFAIGALFLTLAYSDMVFVLAALATALAKTTRIARVPRVPSAIPRMDPRLG